MFKERCPQAGCNAPARILFNLVCSNPLCRNYDESWHLEVYSQPRYKHETIGEHTFLGGFVYDNEYYDLYFSINPLDGSEWIEARYGNELGCYLGSDLDTAQNHPHKVLKEGARRWEEKIMGEE